MLDGGMTIPRGLRSSFQRTASSFTYAQPTRTRPQRSPMRKSTEDRRCVRCERLLYPWHPIEKALCTRCSAERKQPRKPTWTESLGPPVTCVRCAEPVATGGRLLCPEHQRQNLQHLQREGYLVAHNLCVSCRRPTNNEHKKCAECRKKHGRSAIPRARRCLRAGCDQPKSVRSKTYCEAHRLEFNQYINRRARRIAQGLCTICGKAKPKWAADHPRCPDCRG